MLLPAFAGCIGKASGVVFHHRDVFALHPQGRQTGGREQTVQPALSAFGLAHNGGVALRKGQAARVKSRLKHAVGGACVHAHPEAAGRGVSARFVCARSVRVLNQFRHGPARQPHAFLRIFELAVRIACRGCQHRRARQAQTQHAARIVAVHPQICALTLQQHAEAFAARHKGGHNAVGRQGQQRGSAGGVGQASA